jgi:quercetin dioxygenase-like cupin family protein
MSESDVPETSDGARNRAHPNVRFAPPQHEIDLRAVAREMAGDPPRRGQRQRALYSHGRLTVALFTFEPGAGLPDHVAKGVVTINVLDGRLRVKCGGAEHDLTAGKLLVLAPGVRHDVLAEAPSTMLLQVYLDDAAGAKQ